MSITTLAAVLVTAALGVPTTATDSGLDNDGRTDASQGVTDRDLDNDGRTDAQFGGSGRDSDNDGKSD